MSEKKLTCMDCGARACQNADEEKYPDFCLTKTIDDEMLSETMHAYKDQSSLDGKIIHVATIIEGEFYGKFTRVEETVLFIKRMNAKKVGIASCLGLSKEANAFCKILKENGINYTGITCKAGAKDKTEVGIPEEKKKRPGNHESLCNPMLQAKYLNHEKTDLNIVIGLCVGHDSIFMRHSEAPITTLIVKDRVLGHNPAACLYTMDSFYSKLKKPLKD